MASKEECATVVLKLSSTSLERKENAEAYQLSDFKIKSFDSIKTRCIVTKSQIKINRRHGRKRCKRIKTGLGLMTPIRGGEISRRKLCTKVDVRYAKEITKFINKYSTFHSNRKCPTLTERLTRHRVECHSQPSVDTSNNLQERGINVISESQARLDSTKCKTPPVNIGSQTDIILCDNIHVPLKKCATRVIEPKRNIYKEHLKKEIIDWFQNIPIFYSLDFTAQYLKENIAVMLLENINNLATQRCRESYNGLVQKQIDECLNILPMWLPNSKQDQCLFKNNLKNKLYQRIKDLNVIFLETEITNENEINNEVISNNEKEEYELCVDKYEYNKEISDWLDTIKFTIPISTDDITGYILETISSILNDPLRETSFRTNLQEKIKEMLDQLPVHLEYAEHRDVYMHRFAEDLVNRLFNIKIQFDIHTLRTYKNPEMYRIFDNQITNSPPYSNALKHIILEKIDKILKETNLCNGRRDVEMEIFDMVINSLETLQSSIRITSEIFEILCKRCSVTPTKAMEIANEIEASIHIALKQNATTNVNNQLFGVMSVYRSNAENFVTSRKQQDITKLNPSEISYVEKVASLVRAWMETLPNIYSCDKKYKDTIIYEFAEDIMNEKKKEKTSLRSDTEKEYFTDFVNKSFAKFNIFDNPHEAEPFITVLLEKLKCIPVPNLILWDQHSCQAVDNVRDFKHDSRWDDHITPKGTYMLKEQIFVWVNKQPVEIYADNYENKLDKMIEELALILQDHINNNMPKDVIDEDIKQWLNKILKPQDKKRIDELTLSLKDNLIDLPQNLSSDTRKRHPSDKKNPALGIVEFIEDWCDQLPIDAEPNMKIAIKANIAKRLYQKIGEFSINPTVFSDENLYKDLLEDEVDMLFENLPQNPELLRNSANLKAELISSVLDLKKEMEEKFAGANYKHKLETTLNISLPNPILLQECLEPDFEIYKNYVAKMFILDNFDHSNEDIKSKYERIIKYEIDKYFDNAQKKNALLISKEQMYNELYSVLFKVSMPNEESMIDEVEEVKTRCEIDAWFESLPLEAVDDVIEMLKWDQMLSTLTKRIHNLEKNVSEPDQKIHLEINKFLQKLPLLPEKKSYNNIEQYISKLQTALKSSVEARKYVTVDRVTQKGKNILKNKNNICHQNISQVPGPSSNGIQEPHSHSSKHTTIYNNLTPKTYKSPSDQIEDIVENWCNKLPWIGEQVQYEKIKNDTSTKIIIKIYEINMDSDIFDDDIVYDQLLDEELDNIISSLEPYCDFGRTKLASKYQLKEMIKSIKPLIKEDKYRHEYKTQLNEIVDNLLNDHNTTANIAEYLKLKDEIVNNFIQYTCNRNDDDVKQIYKTNIHDAVRQYNTNVKDKGNEQVGSLVRLNQLICELSKLPVPSEAAINDEVEEIKMRNEVEQLFKENNLDDRTEKTEQMKKTLTKTLNDIEKSGHTELNDSKMSADITKCLNKLGKTVNPQVVHNFVDSLKNNEVERKVSQLKSVATASNRNIVNDHISPPERASDSICEHTDAFITEIKPQQPFSQISTRANQLYGKNKITAQENKAPIFNQNIRYHGNSDFQIPTQGFDSLQPPADHVQYLPTNKMDFHTRQHNTRPHSVCRSCGQFVDAQSGNINCQGNSKANLNEPWNIYRPEAIKKKRGSYNYEAFDGKAAINMPVASKEYKSAESCGQSLHRPSQLSRRVSNNPSSRSPDLMFEQAVPMTLKRESKPPRHVESSGIERHRCTCVLKNKCKSKRYCMIPVDEYCDVCGGYRPRWCRVLMPRCPYLNF